MNHTAVMRPREPDRYDPADPRVKWIVEWKCSFGQYGEAKKISDWLHLHNLPNLTPTYNWLTGFENEADAMLFYLEFS